MSIPKAKPQPAPSFRYRKPTRASRRIATTVAASVPSRKNKSSRSPAPASIPTPLDCPERVAEPLNRVLLVDKSSPLVRQLLGSENFRLWCEMNLVVALDYGSNSFSVLKNRWGGKVSNLPLDCLATFLFNPETTDARELNLLRIDHNNKFVRLKPDQ